MKKLETPREVFAELEAAAERAGCKLEQAYVALGQYDFIEIIDAPDEAALKLYNDNAQQHAWYTAKTLACFPAEPFFEWADGDFNPFLNYWMRKARSLESGTRPAPDSRAGFRGGT